jgi:hypothetical protein
MALSEKSRSSFFNRAAGVKKVAHSGFSESTASNRDPGSAWNRSPHRPWNRLVPVANRRDKHLPRPPEPSPAPVKGTHRSGLVVHHNLAVLGNDLRGSI